MLTYVEFIVARKPNINEAADTASLVGHLREENTLKNKIHLQFIGIELKVDLESGSDRDEIKDEERDRDYNGHGIISR
ncbi:hypothetical protein EVAR_79258_1 [Eumeta japonica]|uniref:Uncharacterized protein n=1 Tax=Eumeta variegata TaxID=151549 RepID=A0A4C1THZ1_EUMVA|nr:hypothetical protein EVAR_79258_1 [Eumeta japonica]